MKIGFVGLGKMGGQMVTRLLKGGHEVVVTDLNKTAVDIAVAQGAIEATDREELAVKIGQPAIVWLMIPAGFVDKEIDALLKILPADSIIIDGGNSDFRLTRERATKCAQAKIKLVDVGTSGGVMGLETGFSMMIGGEESAFQTIEPIISTLAQPNGYKYFGPTGAGHYIKMVHNAIEYGVMEAYAEGFCLLKEGSDYPNLDLEAISDVWQHGSIIASNLNEISNQIFRVNPELDGVDGYVTESGEARWTLEVAKEQKLHLPAIQVALDSRVASQNGQINFGTKLLAAMRNVFGGHHMNKDS